MFRKNNLFSAWLREISANSNENSRCYNFQAFANISGNFWKIYNPTSVSVSAVSADVEWMVAVDCACLSPNSYEPTVPSPAM